MNIGIVLSTTPAYSETFFLSKIKGLLASGFDVTLFVQKAQPDFTLCPVVVAPKVFKRNRILQGVNSVMVLIKLLGYPRRLQTFIALEKKAKRSNTQLLKNLVNNAHLLTAHLDWIHFGFATMALQSEHVAKAIRAKMAVSFRGYDIDVYPLKHKGCYHLLWEHVDKVHSISQYLLDKACAMGLSKAKPFHIITPAIDLKTFNPDTPKQHQPLQVLTIARLEWIKGLSYTIEAIALLKQQGLKLHYTIIGDGRAKEELVFSVHQLGLTDWVTLLNRVSHDEIRAHLLNADIYIQYSNSEGFCNAVLEAQAMGCLCIVSDGGALPENVLDGQTGWVVEKRNPKALANCIEEVINLPEASKDKISKNAIRRVKEEFGLKMQQEQFLKFYEEIAG